MSKVDSDGPKDHLKQAESVSGALERLLRLSAKWVADRWLRENSTSLHKPPRIDRIKS